MPSRLHPRALDPPPPPPDISPRVWALEHDMNRRSRGGCIDCRRSKVKCDGIVSVFSLILHDTGVRFATIWQSCPILVSLAGRTWASQVTRSHPAFQKSFLADHIFRLTPEIKPRCGTCCRRRIVCQGYHQRAASGPPNSKGARSQARHNSPGGPDAASNVAQKNKADTEVDCDSSMSMSMSMSMAKRPFSRFNEPMTTSLSSTTIPKAGHPLIMDPGLMTPRALGLIPPGVVNPGDQATVEVYFNRHPWELSMGSEFVNEMNANVLTILQQNPQAIVDSLSAIGHSYLADSPLAVLNYRARILATLRSMDLAKYSLEEIIFMLLGLSAIELVDLDCSTGPETTIPAVIANSAALLRHYLSLGRELSSLARYFTRALARQDMILSLVHLHRPLIPTTVWLDEKARQSADRLMGYTATFMPLLEELAILAEDMRMRLQFPGCGEQLIEEQLEMPSSGVPAVPSDAACESGGFSSTQAGCCAVSTLVQDEQLPSHGSSNTFDLFFSKAAHPRQKPPPVSTSHQLADLAGLLQRADDLRARIELWKPPLPHGLSFRKSRRFLSQAACYRAGALLYLFRLLNPPGCASHSSPSVMDEEATARAHEVLMSTSVAVDNPDEVKMLLWPVFLAACEMSAEEDRQMVLDILDTILSQRKTATVQKIKSFVLNRVWPARDQGQAWNWMLLAQKHPGECLPI